MSGFIVMARDATEHPLLQDGERFRAWFWMVAKACWKPTPFDIHGKIVTLDRGQFCCSVRELADTWGWSKSTVERFLTRLKTEAMIGTDAGTGRLIITICNYTKYQDVPKERGTANGTPSGTAAGQQRDIKEQGNQLPLSKDNGGADFWAFAVAYLGEGRRSIIGKWRKDFGQAEVANAITQAQFANAVEPVAYIERTLRGAKATAGEVW
jgi:hypothetical protein